MLFNKSSKTYHKGSSPGTQNVQGQASGIIRYSTAMMEVSTQGDCLKEVAASRCSEDKHHTHSPAQGMNSMYKTKPDGPCFRGHLLSVHLKCIVQENRTARIKTAT